MSFKGLYFCDDEEEFDDDKFVFGSVSCDEDEEEDGDEMMIGVGLGFCGMSFCLVLMNNIVLSFGMVFVVFGMLGGGFVLFLVNVLVLIEKVVCRLFLL